MTKVRRVLFIQTQGENAGAQQISRLVGAGLSARGYDVEHLFFYRKSATFDEPPNTSYCISRRPGNPLAALQFLWGLGRGIRNAKADAIFTFQHYGNTFGGAIACLTSPAPIIANQVSPGATIHAVVRAVDIALGVFGAFKYITVNSIAMLQEYSRYPTSYSRRLKHIPHGFDQKQSQLSKSGARQCFGLPTDVPLMGSVARLHPIKRLDAAIRMLRHQPTWHLALAGQGQQEHELRQLAVEIKVSDRVHFVGEMHPERIGDFLAGLDVFVFPTRTETFGLAAVEAAAAGIPVVAMDLPILHEVLAYKGQPAAIFVDASDDQLLAASVARVLADSELRARLVQNGVGLRTRYSVTRMIDEYEALLTNLAPSKGPIAIKS